MHWGVSVPSGRFGSAIRAICATISFALAALTANPALADSAQATATAQATIVTALGLVKVQDLKFGRIAARPTTGTVTVDPNNGTCAVTGAIISAGGCQYAEFAGMGARRMLVRIQVPGGVTLIGPAGSSILVDNLTLGTAPELSLVGGNGNGNGNGNQRYQIVSNTGVFTFRVGGRAHIGANQRPGVYTAQFTVQVNYQ